MIFLSSRFWLLFGFHAFEDDLFFLFCQVFVSALMNSKTKHYERCKKVLSEHLLLLLM